MLDHIGFPVSDYERAKAFYARALAPLGYSLVMEVTQEASGHDLAAGFGADPEVRLAIGAKAGCQIMAARFLRHFHDEAVAERRQRPGVERFRPFIVGNRKADVVEHLQSPSGLRRRSLSDQ